MRGLQACILATLALAAAIPWQCAAARPAQIDLVRSCEAVAALKLANTKIIQAIAIRPPPDYIVPGTEQNLPERGGPTRITASFCRVAGVVASAIRFEVWLPLEGWNGRFEGVGNGAFSGAVPYPAMAAALARGYAVGGTDTGHQSSFTDAAWTQSAHGLDTEVLADWAHRGVHEMSIKSQQVVRAVFGRAAHHSYFVGCSSGGHQALTEAQRYPQDYDGILAGAPANYWTHLMAGQLWYGLATRVDPLTNLEAPVSKLQAIHNAALQACDAADGVKDGVIENPLSCRFDPQVLACSDQDSAACLSAPQIQALRKIYGNAQGSGGEKIFPGLAPGGEMAWPSMSANQVPFAQTFYRYIVFQKPDWDYTSMNFPADVADADRRVGALLNSNDPDLRLFRAHGGKLIQYHGWSDPLISPYNSIDYYEAVVAKVGGKKTRQAALAEVQTFHRLFMVPGMNHCRGGDGPDSFEGLEALTQWVEHGNAPDKLTAVKLADGKPIRTRPICPYPLVARYRGSGSTDEEASFECVRA